MIKQSDDKTNVSKKKFNRTKGNLMGAEILQNNKKGSFKNENAYFLSDSQLINSDSKKEKRILDTSTVSNKKQKEMKMSKFGEDHLNMPTHN